MEADPVTTARVIEEVAKHNTAAGWSLMVANTIPMMLVKLPDEGISALYEKNLTSSLQALSILQ